MTGLWRPGPHLAYALRSATRTALWALVAFFIGLLFALAYIHANDQACQSAAAAGSDRGIATYCLEG